MGYSYFKMGQTGHVFFDPKSRVKIANNVIAKVDDALLTGSKYFQRQLQGGHIVEASQTEWDDALPNNKLEFNKINRKKKKALPGATGEDPRFADNNKSTEGDDDEGSGSTSEETDNDEDTDEDDDEDSDDDEEEDDDDDDAEEEKKTPNRRGGRQKKS